MLIFLDIDGVMVPAKSWRSPELLKDGFPAFSLKACHTLQRMISDNDTVILTTSHKSNFTIQEWKNIFKERGIEIAALKALPENNSRMSRKDEILRWFNQNTINEEFLIIDDDSSLNDLPTDLKKHLIQPSPFIGLSEDHLRDFDIVLSRK
ncbi:MAG: HAD domain-containing protein [bacterium]|jgi:hypothetical protein